MSKKLLAAVLALGILPAAPSQADIIFGQTSVDTDCNVTFNGPGDISGPETTVSGTCGDAVVFFRASEDLVTPGGGQARIEAEDGRFLRIQFELGDDLVSQTAEFNIQIAQDTAGTFVVTIDSFQLVGGVLVPETFTSDPFTLGTGENRTFAMAVAGTNEFIDVVTIMGNSQRARASLTSGKCAWAMSASYRTAMAAGAALSLFLNRWRSAFLAQAS